MKTLLPLITALILSILPLAAKADPVFGEIGNNTNFNYSYISPVMAKAIRAQNRYYIDNTQDLRINYDDIQEVEIVETLSSGTDPEFWKLIRDTIKKYDLKTLSINKNGYFRFDIMGKFDSHDRLSHLLLLRQHGGNNVNLTFITGSIPVESLYNGMVQ